MSGAVEFDDVAAHMPEHWKMEVENQVCDALRDLADRKRVLGQITREQEMLVLDLLQEAFG